MHLRTLLLSALLIAGLVLPGTAADKAKRKGDASAVKTDAAKPAALVDLNNASAKELDALPGVGPATAKKIIAGRPYASPSDLAKAGIPAATIAKLRPLVTAGPAPAAPAAAPRCPFQSAGGAVRLRFTAASRAHARAARRFRHGLGESRHQGLSPRRRPLVWQDQSRQLYDRGRSRAKRLPRLQAKVGGKIGTEAYDDAVPYDSPVWSVERGRICCGSGCAGH